MFNQRGRLISVVRNHFFIRAIIKNLCYKLLGGWVGWGKLSFQCLRPSASLRAAGKKFWNIAKRDQVGAAPSRLQMMAVGCQRAFAARTAVTWFERHLVADIFCEPHETKKLIKILPYYIAPWIFQPQVLTTMWNCFLVHCVCGKVCLHFVLDARVTSICPNWIFNSKKCHFAQSNFFLDKIIAGYSLPFGCDVTSRADWDPWWVL
jgi:hypothetical protein